MADSRRGRPRYCPTVTSHRTNSSPHAIRIVDGQPQLEAIDLDDPALTADPDGVRIRVASSTICGSDLHMLSMGFAEGRVLGHEFAGTTPDGTAVAVEPIGSCGTCPHCLDGERPHCESGTQLFGIARDGGMATDVIVPAQTLVPLPSGLDVSIASMVEPLAVALHGVNRAAIRETDRVLIIGAGTVGLATAAVLRDRGVTFDVVARHDHQAVAATSLGAAAVVGDSNLAAGGYDVVVDAVGTKATVDAAVVQLVPLGRLVMLGVFWEPVPISMPMLMKEITMIPAMMYRGTLTAAGDSREFTDAARILHARPDIESTIVTHRFPLDGAVEAFATAQDRAGGAIKVGFTF